MAENKNSPFVVEVDESNFAAEVIAKSQTVPVLVDFWAAWCGPCRSLGPTLERLAVEFNGAFVLAKLDTEKSPQLSADFGIRSIPDVKLISKGHMVDGFTGALPEAAIREFLRRHIQSKSDKQLAEARELEAKDDIAGARRLYESVLADEPDNAMAHLQLARLLITESEIELAESHLDAIRPMAPEADTVPQLRQVIEFRRVCQGAGGLAKSRKEAEKRPNDLNAHYALACCLVAEADYSDALDELIHILSKDKEFQEGAARRAMLAIFTVIGERSDLANEYRRRLASLIY